MFYLHKNIIFIRIHLRIYTSGFLQEGIQVFQGEGANVNSDWESAIEEVK